MSSPTVDYQTIHALRQSIYRELLELLPADQRTPAMEQVDLLDPIMKDVPGDERTNQLLKQPVFDEIETLLRLTDSELVALWEAGQASATGIHDRVLGLIAAGYQRMSQHINYEFEDTLLGEPLRRLGACLRSIDRLLAAHFA